MIGDQSDMLAAQRREFVRLEHIDPCLHASRAARFFHCGARGNADSKNEKEA
jgi:hypothetical protein